MRFSELILVEASRANLALTSENQILVCRVIEGHQLPRDNRRIAARLIVDS